MQAQTQTKPKHTTRAEFYRNQVQIRIAVDKAGPQIAAVLKANGIELPACDWNHVSPSWLIATMNNDVVGCVQVMPVQPVGYVNFLYVKPSISFKFKAVALRKLGLAAISTMHYAGVHYVAGLVSQENKKLLNVLEKLNFAKLADGAVMIKYISGETTQ